MSEAPKQQLIGERAPADRRAAQVPTGAFTSELSGMGVVAGDHLDGAHLRRRRTFQTSPKISDSKPVTLRARETLRARLERHHRPATQLVGWLRGRRQTECRSSSNWFGLMADGQVALEAAPSGATSFSLALGSGATVRARWTSVLTGSGGRGIMKF